MKASVNFASSGSINPAHRRNTLQRGYKVLAIKNGALVEHIDARIYGTQARSYACVWLSGPKCYRSGGSGYASGYGYHRSSAALESALNAAGATLSTQIGGVGDSAIRESLLAVGHVLSEGAPCYLIECFA